MASAGAAASTINIKNNKLQLILLLLLSPILAHVPAGSQVEAAESSAASSSQPLWSYQVKPNNYANAPGGSGGGGPQVGHHFAASTGPSSIFDAFNGLSQRQGALTGSPFLSILPIILIAAGGMLLLLPFLTMMMASPFGAGGAFGGGGGGYGGNGFGFPQVAALGKKRSLAGANDQSFGQRGGGLVDLIEHVSSTIDELSRKYQHQPPVNNNINKRAKVMGQQATATATTTTTTTANESAQNAPPPTNHRHQTSAATSTGSNNEEPNPTGSGGNNSLASSSNAVAM